MRWLVLVRPRAEADIAGAQAWYDAQRAGLGGEFLDEIARAVRLLEENPDRPPLYYGGFRRLLVRRFPYKFFYRVEGARVVVFRLLHARRDHPRWL